MKTLGLLALLVVTALVYSPLRSAGAVYEDRNPWIDVEPRLAPDLRGGWEGWAMERPIFSARPRMLSNVTMRLQGWHADAIETYHGVNVAVHLVNGILLWALLVPAGVVPTFWMTALWLLHPIQSQAVNYVSARPDLLMTTMVLLMLWASQRTTWSRIVLTGSCALLAMLAKESGVVVLALLPLWLVWQRRWEWRWGVAVTGLACVMGWMAFRLAYPLSAIRAYTAPAPHGPFWSAAVQAAALWRLLALVVWPVGFTIDHDFDLVGPGLALLAAGALVAVIVMAWRARARWPAAAFGVAWVLLALAPRFVVPLPDYVGERHCYLAFLGLALAAGGWQKAAA